MPPASGSYPRFRPPSLPCSHPPACISAGQTFFEPLLPLDKIHKRLEVFVALRGLMTAAGVEGLLLAYAGLLEQYPAPPAAMDKIAAAR
jgi:hypothetical protein